MSWRAFAFGVCLAVVLALAGCASSQPIPTSDNPCGLPNFAQVEARAFRSGQPTTEAQWRCVRDVLGVTDTLKLDRESEGHDDPAFVHVHVVAIPPWTGGVDFASGPDPQQVDEIEAVLRSIPGSGGRWLIHCVHGQDRTGVVVGMYRVLGGWPVAKAKAEMDAYGFHDSLLGLRAAWDRWTKGRP